MKSYERIKKIFDFDRAYSEFELAETEHGQPRKIDKRVAKEAPIVPERRRLYASIDANLRWIRRDFHCDINSDIILRNFLIGKRTKALAVFINGMCDEKLINDFILKPSFRICETDNVDCSYAVDNIFSMQEIALSRDRVEARTAISEGRTALFIEGDNRVILFDTRKYPYRQISESKNETVVMGPNEAFTENIRTNITQLRRIVKNSDFVCEFRDAGAKNHVRVALLYMKGTVNPSLLNEVKRRLALIDTDAILDIGMVEQLIEEHPFSPVAQALTTEKPDRAAMAAMQGKLVLLCDGSPAALVMPISFSELLVSPEDSYHRQPLGMVIRIVRLFGAAISVLMPAYFLALALHHQGLLSSEVINTVISSRQLVFLPISIEMIFLLLVFQLVREAGIRVPGAAGQTVGIIGGLMLGQAAVAANIVSTVVLIIVALCGLGNYTIPNYGLQLSITYLRLLLCIAASLGGLLGFFCALLIVVALLCNLKSYGVPMLAPFAPRTYHKHNLLLRTRLTPHQKPVDYTNTEENA